MSVVEKMLLKNYFFLSTISRKQQRDGRKACAGHLAKLFRLLFYFSVLQALRVH